jgi:hypothetical protein
MEEQVKVRIAAEAEVEAKEEEERIKANSYCTICKRNGHETQDCFFKCNRCKIPLILTETVGTKKRQMVVERTI